MEHGTVEILKLLASDIRFNALVMLAEAGAKGVPAGMIAEHCGVTPQGASQQLGTLKLAGLVTAEKRGTAVIYRLREDPPVPWLVTAALAYGTGKNAALFVAAGRKALAYDAGREA